MSNYLNVPLSRKARRRLHREQLGRANAVNTVLPPGAATDTYRTPSPAIWMDCPLNSLKEEGSYFEDDFIMTGNNDNTSASVSSVGRWSQYGYAGSTITDEGREGGVVGLQSNDDAEGMTLLSSTGSFRFLTTSTLALNKRMWFEARVARSSVTTDNIEFFVGLMKPTLSSGLPAAAQPITATDDTLMTAGDFFGFHSNSNTGTRGGPTEVAAAFVLASGTINYPTNGTALMADSGNSVLTANAFVKLGFRFDPQGPYRQITSATARQTAGARARALIEFYINGRRLPMFLSSDDVVNATAGQAFPTAFMCPVLSIFNTAGSSPGKLLVDWIRVAQEPNS